MTYLATNHSSVANLLFYFDSSLVPESLNSNYHDKKNDKAKEKVVEGGEISQPVGSEGDIPITIICKALEAASLPSQHRPSRTGILVVFNVAIFQAYIFFILLILSGKLA